MRGVAERCLVRGHHLPLGTSNVDLPGGRPGSVLTPRGRLCTVEPTQCEVDRSGADAGIQIAWLPDRIDVSFRSGLLIQQRNLSATTGRVWNRSKHESPRELLGQRANGTLLWKPEIRVDSGRRLRRPGPGVFGYWKNTCTVTTTIACSIATTATKHQPKLSQCTSSCDSPPAPGQRRRA